MRSGGELKIVGFLVPVLDWLTRRSGTKCDAAAARLGPGPEGEKKTRSIVKAVFFFFFDGDGA